MSTAPPSPLLPLNTAAHPSPFQTLKPTLLLILLILSVTFLVSVSICFLLRHLNRRCLRHLSHPTTASSSSNRHSSSNRVSPELSIVDSLPLFSFSSIKRASANSAVDCAVCLSKFEPHDQLRLLPLCCHAFHVDCIDTWLRSNQTCPLCRSSIHASESNVLKALSTDGAGAGSESFRLEIGSISRRQTAPDSVVESRSSYSIGSFEYLVEEDSEITVSQTHRSSFSDKETVAAQQYLESNLASDVSAGGRSWLKDYVDRLSTSLSSRALSFRSSGRFFTGSSRRSETVDYDVEGHRMGEEISEMFRWFSGV
ncbi:E3 ubiquitin-protein ligase ATL4 [Mercurialis annua]|uniref:E3 ubiquitin-protein ligase ATL4 n=1 Tax=Mercurialis annua TaxID=3986 RepID=UPI00215E3163|nr:E3 ubiquitin-protein ligase ATL4 [Mercurialis annua]